MYRYEDIRRVHLEVSSKCNASCPQCPRNLQGGKVNPDLPVGELTLDDARRIFQPDFIGRLRQMFMCGNYGDPMTARDTLEIFRHFREHGPNVHLSMVTNGSGRTANWWRELASVVDNVTFSVDGFADTNHVYRRGTQWEHIERAMTSFIGGGGSATWQFIAFRHNEHQVEEARQRSIDMGFKKFVLKKSYRFRQGGVIQEAFPVYDRDGNFEYNIEMPLTPKYRNEALVGIDAHLKTGGTWDGYLAETPIVCKSVTEGEIYVSAEGHVFPCCFTANLYQPGTNRAKHQIWQLLNAMPNGADDIRGTTRPLRDIVEGEFFQKAFLAGWEQKAVADGRLAVCARVCGTYDMQQATRHPEDLRKRTG